MAENCLEPFCQLVRVDGATSRRGEDQLRIVRPATSAPADRSCLPILKCFEHPILKLNNAAAAGSFSFSKTPPSTDFLERAHNANRPANPINVLPFQRQVFAWP